MSLDRQKHTKRAQTQNVLNAKRLRLISDEVIGIHDDIIHSHTIL